MPHIFRKLTKCIHRPHHVKNVQSPSFISPMRYFFTLSRFELMPDEILIQIFEYIPLIDLFHGFINLNFRLNFLLRDLHLGVFIDQNDHSNEYLLNALYYFRKQITYIHVDHYPLLNLDLFSNLRSLIIYLPTTNQLLSIKPQSMPYLCRLWFGLINQRDQQIIQTLFFGQNQFRKLHFCHLFELNFHDQIHFYNYSLSIRKLFVRNCRTKDFLFFLSLLPNLDQLEICLSDVRSTLSQNYLRKNYSHLNLRILKIEFSSKFAQLNLLNSLLTFVPYIQRCTLILMNLIQIADYIHLQTILGEKCLQLKELICSIDYSCQLASNQMSQIFHRLTIQLPFYQTMKVIPCIIHQNQCVRKTSMNKRFQTIS